MPTQEYKSESIELLSAHFPKRNESSYAWGRVNGLLQSIPYCRGAWNFCNRTSTVISDISGLGKNLVAAYSTLPYGELAQYLACPGAGAGPYRADEADNRFTGSMQIGCWVWFDAVAARQDFFCKWTAAGNLRSYMLSLIAGPTLRFYISGTGADSFSVTSTVIPAANTWYYVVGQYDSALQSLKIFVNGTLDTNIAGIPAAMNAGTSRLEFGASEAGTLNHLTGRIAYGWMGQYNSSQLFLRALYDHQRPLFGL
jgi:hypothetical protein